MSTKQMKDFDMAKNRLVEASFSLVIVKNRKVLFETNASGVRGFLAAIERIGKDLKGSALADRIVGEAAAQLCAYSCVREVYAIVLSQCGKDVLKKNRIRFEYENMVPHILNMKKTDLCPFEKIVSGSTTPQEAYERLRKGLPSYPR
jgi:hypothetical protein